MIDNRLQLYFHQLIQQLGWLLVVFGLLVLFGAVPIPARWISLFFILIGLFFSLTYEGVQLDLRNRKIKQYVGFLGLSFGSWKSLPDLTQIVLTSSKYSQQIHAIVSRKQLDTRLYRGFLKGVNTKLLFTSKNHKEEVMEQVSEVAEQLNLPATDYTVKPPNIIR